MLKRKLDEEAFAGLDDNAKTLYQQNEDGAYSLLVEPSEQESAFEQTMADFDKLRRGKDRETQTAKELRTELSELKKQLTTQSDDDARKKGDIELLDKSWQEKMSSTETEFTGKLEKSHGFIKKFLVDGVAKDIANEISTEPALILPHIKTRLRADFEGDEPMTKVLDGDGQISALTVDDLKKEFRNNKTFSGIIKASKASGGGAGGGGNTNGGATSLKDMTATEEAKFANENPEAYKKMVKKK